MYIINYINNLLYNIIMDKDARIKELEEENENLSKGGKYEASIEN